MSKINKYAKSKINKYANLYDKDGNLLKKAPLTDYTIEETEKLVDDLTEQYKNDPENKDLKLRLDNAAQYLYGLYLRYGNPHEKELVERIKQAANKDVSEDQIKEALNAVSDELKKTYNTDTNDDEYVEFTEDVDNPEQQ